MKTTEQQQQRIEVQLSDRTVSISPAEWPEIGGVRGDHECGQSAQNGRTWWRIHIRQHADGRALVYLRTGGGCQCNRPHHHAGDCMPSGWTRTQLESALRTLVALGRECGDDFGDCDDDVRRAMQSLPTVEL